MASMIEEAAYKLAEKRNFRNECDDVARKINKIVTEHAILAVSAAWIPIPGADMAAMTANIWSMYVRISKACQVRISDKTMKNIGAAVLGNLSSNLLSISAASLLKFIPGSFIFTGIAASAATYALTVTSAWVYIRALTKFVAQDMNDDGTLNAYINSELSNKQDIQSVFREAKSNYKK